MMIKTHNHLKKIVTNLCIHTRLTAFIILLFSLIVSGLNFGLLTGIQNHVIHTNIIISKNVTEKVEKQIRNYINKNIENDKSLHSILEEIYLSDPLVHCVQIVNDNGDIYDTIPQQKTLLFFPIKNNSNKHFNDDILHQSYNQLVTIPLKHNINPTTIIKCPILKDDHFTDYFILLTLYYNNFNNIPIAILSITNFISIWFVTTVAILLNQVSTLRVMQKLIYGFHSIRYGYFNTIIQIEKQDNFKFLIHAFNQMAARLYIYEEKHVDQLTNEKSKLEALVSIITDGVILLDQELRFIFLNNAAYTILPFLKHGITGTYIYNNLPQSLNNKLLPNLNKMVKNHNDAIHLTHNKKITVKLEDKKERIIEFLITTILDNQKQILTGFGIIVKDITRDIELNKAKRQFISNVSHELRTPLFNIKSFLETLREYDDSLSTNEKKEFLAIANQETTRLTCLINDVLDLSCLEHAIVYRFTQIHAEDMILPVMQASQLRSQRKQVKILFQQYILNYKIYGHNPLLIQVISNLIDNSLKFTSSGGRITIKIYIIPLRIGKHKKIRIEIIDDGHGIDIRDQSNIFDRFVRIENNVHTLEGTGLGLSIVKNIIQKHNSQIQLYSEQNVGSSFWFDLYTID